MTIKVRVLQANHGDCILVTHQSGDNVFNLLVDGGNSATFMHGAPPRHKGALCLVLDELKMKGECIDLAILTHIDDDHIGGLISAFKAPGYLREMVKSVWFNSSRLITDHFNEPRIVENDIRLNIETPDTSVQQGKSFEALLDEIGCKRGPLVQAGLALKSGPFEFNILSPNESALKKLLCIWPKENISANTSTSTDYKLSFEEILANDKFESDKSITNGSSIAFILRADDVAMLFLGDAHDEVVISELKALDYSPKNRLTVDMIKVSHHGSQYNLSSEFLSLVKSRRFIISTNGSVHGLPNKRTIARILTASDGNVYFNYENIIKQLRLPDEKSCYPRRLLALSRELILND